MSNKRHKYFNKVPPFKPYPEKCTRKQHSCNAKEDYYTDDDGLKLLNRNPKFKALGLHPYLCKVCSKWHIGRLHN